MSIEGLQKALIAAGYDCGPSGADGDLGPATYAALINFAAKRQLGQRGLEIGRGLALEFPKAEINTRQRIIHAIAQAAHESGGFRYMQELGGPDYFKRYDGRTDLGNTQPGDGNRFHGRGLIQITGRHNYTKFGKLLGLDLIADPDLAAQPMNAARVFAAYWGDRRLNVFADVDNIETITRKINGGLSGLDDRKAYVARLKGVWPA